MLITRMRRVRIIIKIYSNNLTAYEMSIYYSPRQQFPVNVRHPHKRSRRAGATAYVCVVIACNQCPREAHPPFGIWILSFDIFCAS
jgi:hypothetical protein